MSLTQFSKADVLIVSSISGIRAAVSAEHPKNASLSMFFTPVPNDTEVIPVLFLNARSPIFSSEFGRVRDVMDGQSVNAPLPITFWPLNVIDESLIFRANASSPISVKVAGS